MKIEHKVVCLSVVGAALIWVADAAFHHVFLYPGISLWSLVLAEVPLHDTFTRIIGALLVLIVGLIAAIRIRDLRETQNVLKQETDRVSITLKSIGDAVIASDEQGCITAMNPVAERLTGWSQAQALGLPLPEILQLVDLTTRVQCESPISKVHRTGRVSEFKNGTVLIAKDGTERIIAESGAPIRDSRGRIMGVVVVFRDVTAEKRAEQALIASEAKFRLLYEQAPLGYQSLDEDGRIREVNRVWLKTLGYSREEVIGQWFGDFLTPQSKDAFREKFEFFKIGEEIHGREFDMVKKDGTIMAALFDGTIARNAEGGFLRTHCVLQDITEKKRAEEALRQNEQMLAQIINFLPDAAFVIDDDGSVVAWNRAVEELTGVKERDMLGKSNYEYSLAFYPDRKPVLIDAALNPGKEFDQHYLYVKREGEVLVSESDSSTLKIPGIHLWNRARPLYDSQGNIMGAVESMRDITDRKKAQETALQAERLKAIVDLAAGVAHNFNNLLQIIVGGLDLSILELEQNNLEEVRKNLQQMLESCQFGAETVRRLQSFANVRADLAPHDNALFDLSETIHQAVEMSKPLWKTTPERTGITIDLSLAVEDGCIIKGRQSEMFEVLVNLIKNATEALPNGGAIDISLAVEGHQVVLRVHDTGVGIPAEELRKVFEPFWSTKRVAAGTGMGLAVCHGIVIRHGGTITADSVPGHGATFTVRVPLADEVPVPSAAEAVDISDLNLTVLAVDDMVPIVTMFKQILTLHGQEVFTATSGLEALALFQANSVDVVICDLGMPEMNGWEVFKIMKQICTDKNIPKPPFVLLTGWGGQALEEDRMLESGVAFVLGKPLDTKKIITALRNAQAILTKSRSLGPN